jgi:radical SAM superfamily enzyme YgiQ (UPF0313 family)
MRLRILLINPWAYDFAAYNLWARPLGLLRVAEYLGSFDAELLLIDCTDSVEIREYGTGKFRMEPVKKPEVLKDIPRLYKRYGIGIDEFMKKVRESLPVDIVLMTSMMSWWYPGVEKTVEIVRDIMGDVPVVLGGIYATLCHEHASRFSGADFIYRGSLNECLKFALSTFGFKLRKKTVPRPYYGLNLYPSYPFAPILTSTGCPFRCSYCASGLLTENFRRRPVDEVVEEVRALRALGVRDLAFYDDALLIDHEGYIKPILRQIVDEGLEVRFHTPNGLHARFIDEELASLMRKTNFRTIRLGLETVNTVRQISTGGKVSIEDLEGAVRFLWKKGFTKKEVGVYLMYGLPGQELLEVREGITFLKTMGVRINLTEFSPIKGTQSWQELVEKGTINDDLDPLLTNNTVFTYLYSGYDPQEVEKIKLEVKEYNNMTAHLH